MGVKPHGVSSLDDSHLMNSKLALSYAIIHTSRGETFTGDWGIMHQVQNGINDLLIRPELGVVDPIQEFLESGMEGLYRRSEGNYLRLPFARSHTKDPK
jgi:hypothetical protein